MFFSADKFLFVFFVAIINRVLILCATCVTTEPSLFDSSLQFGMISDYESMNFVKTLTVAGQ